jgi:hypothetical protein
MKQITKITSQAYQTQIFVLDDGTSFEFVLRFRPNQIGWFFEQIVYGDFEVNTIRVCNSPNLLFQFQNKIPFGIACFSVGNREPMLGEDFSSGASKLYVLSPADVAEYAQFVRSDG